MRGSAVLTLAVPLALATPASAQVPVFDGLGTTFNYAAMSSYLARDGGRWRAPNPNHDDSPSSPPEFGLWFTYDGSDLRLEIVLHYPDSDVVSSSGGWSWLPSTDRLAYRMTDRRGGSILGETTFELPSVFITESARDADGSRTVRHRDVNVLIDDDHHRNETFEWTPDGWVSRGVYEWRRVPR